MITEANAIQQDDGTREPALITRAQEGDLDAFGELYAMHRVSVAAFIRQRVGNHRALTEDITAEVFLRAFRKLKTFQWTGKSLRSWLFTIARNIVNDHYKSRATQRLVLFDDMPVLSDHLGVVAPPPEEEILEQAEADALVSAMGKITEQQRRILELRFLQELSVPETAAALGLSEGATKTAQYRALRTLQQNRTLRATYLGAA
ncbi:RNA polymerase sigma factor [Streptomyces cylindrosporus]|uniref:Sigma-70 family RNA polymerase sigma factor n=1 Tax=Streptomyces cylindrosporus TaxID=2927583 RepID=A0ABS9YK67_9ACTN|nr:sigma-70 family RNA polymerase sigma factor [Streptomyces cylindrosporus]MCI3277560.1 sigma-70 family RNA polymerase sigma factor [Streptomyces cylindrosporus]